MEIQEESPLPLDPLADLDDDYGAAVIHVAWDRHRETQHRTLLFAFIELLPKEIPPPLDDYEPRSPRCTHRLGQHSDHYVDVRHVEVTARQGLEWYLACRDGTAILPSHEEDAPADTGRGKPLHLVKLGEEPRWPTLVSQKSGSDTIPFAPEWIQTPRTHHLLPVAPFDLDALWSKSEQREALLWLDARLHLNLGEYPEYVGSIHLIAPNPVYRRLNSRLQPREQPAESVLFRFQPRQGKTLSGLEMIVSEADPWGVGTSQRVNLQGPLARMNFGRGVNAIKEDVWDPRRGFLEVSDNGNPFIRSIHTSISIIKPTLVSGLDSSYEVRRSGEPLRTVAGSKRVVADARSRLVGAYYARKKRRAAEAQEQRWFLGQEEEARDLLRSLLNEATHQVLLIDAYFGARELGKFMLAVGRHDIPIRILSSAEVLKKQVTKVDPSSALEKGDQILRELRHLESQENVNPFEIRVMTGKRPAIHDRFLAIDKRIWLVGSSLNEFGSRGTMMLEVPNPDAVRDELLKAWADATPLEKWVEQRQGNRGNGGGAT